MAEQKRRRYLRLPKRRYGHGDVVPLSAIYECSWCENITAFQKGETFPICEHCQSQDESARWERTSQIVHFVSKDLNSEFERIETFGLKAADVLAEFSGSLTFVVVHIVWFWWWIHVNTGGSTFGIRDFDPYPFGLLTMIVSLEAIILATFILISQNRQAQKSELRAELDYQVNVNTEKNVAELLSMIKELRDREQAVDKRTSEILEDTAQIVEEVEEERKQRRPRRKAAHKKRKGRHIIREAGIDVVESGE